MGPFHKIYTNSGTRAAIGIVLAVRPDGSRLKRECQQWVGNVVLVPLAVDCRVIVIETAAAHQGAGVYDICVPFQWGRRPDIYLL